MGKFSNFVRLIFITSPLSLRFSFVFTSSFCCIPTVASGTHFTKTATANTSNVVSLKLEQRLHVQRSCSWFKRNTMLLSAQTPPQPRAPAPAPAQPHRHQATQCQFAVEKNQMVLHFFFALLLHYNLYILR